MNPAGRPGSRPSPTSPDSSYWKGPADRGFFSQVPEALVLATTKAPKHTIHVWCVLDRLRQKTSKVRDLPFRSRADLADDLGISVTSVKGSLRWLEDHGWVTVRHRVFIADQGFRYVEGNERPSAPSEFEVHHVPVQRRGVGAE